MSTAASPSPSTSPQHRPKHSLSQQQHQVTASLLSALLAPQFLHCKCCAKIAHVHRTTGVSFLPFFFFALALLFYLAFAANSFLPFLFYNTSNFPLLVSRCCYICHLIYGRKKSSLDGNRDKKQGTTIITTYMTFLFCLVQIHSHLHFAISSIFHIFFFSCFISTTVDADGEEMD